MRILLVLRGSRVFENFMVVRNHSGYSFVHFCESFIPKLYLSMQRVILSVRNPLKISGSLSPISIQNPRSVTNHVVFYKQSMIFGNSRAFTPTSDDATK